MMAQPRLDEARLQRAEDLAGELSIGLVPDDDEIRDTLLALVAALRMERERGQDEERTSQRLASHLAEVEAQLVVERERAERLERALDNLHGEVSRWVYLDQGPDGKLDAAYWRDLAKSRAVWVEDAARAALAEQEKEQR